MIKLNIPYVQLHTLLSIKELSVKYEILNELNEVLDNPYIPKFEYNTDWLQILSRKFTDTNFRANRYYDHTIEDKVNEIHSEYGKYLLLPFSYVNCKIDCSDWSLFFNMYAPKYELPFDASTVWDKVFYSKKEAIKYSSAYWEVPTNELEIEWDKVNISSVNPEIQDIAEQLYDLWKND